MRRLVLLALAVLGFGVAGYAVFLWPAPAETTYYLDTRAVPETAATEGPVVAYADLSPENRRLFDRALGDRTARVGADASPLNARYVRYEGTYYETTVRATTPSDGTGPDRLAMFAVGALGTLVGTFALLGVWLTSWQLSRSESEHTDAPRDGL